jgi:hypothetical protein
VEYPVLSADDVAAAAGLLAGILAGWRADANPGALDDMTESPPTYTDTGAYVTLLFANGETFVLRCTLVS